MVSVRPPVNPLRSGARPAAFSLWYAVIVERRPVQRHSSLTRATVAPAIILAAAVTSAAASPVPPAADGMIRAGLRDLHDGLYDRAETSFRQAARAVPGDPGPKLFIAFDLWWRILEDPADQSRDGPFLDTIQEAVEAGDHLLQESPDDVRVRTAVGTAHILRSQVEGLRHNFFKASQEARRGKKSLEAVLAADRGYRDALFGLGAYNYYTEKIPGLARGLLFMPHGDADLGLRQLKTLAESDSYFSTDALLLLALICASRDEQCYGDALAHLAQALRRSPGSPLILGTIAGLKTRLMDYPAAIEGFEKALAAASGSGEERARQRRILSLYLADALVADWRLARAAEVLRDVGDADGLPGRDRQALERVAREIALKCGEPPGPLPAAAPGGSGSAGAGPPVRNSPGTAATPVVPLGERVHAALRSHEEGRDIEALSILEAAAGDRPQHPLPRMLSGRLLFLAGNDAGAARELAAARERATDPPPWMAGSIELYLALAESHLGHHAAAREHFQAASQVKRFRSVERALLELQEGSPPHGRCSPSAGREGERAGASGTGP
ncbi:MAG: hypothetical protein AUI47_11385 [Acidobacteria bacterium 13_1_40CM_2_68_5]|nr:MAG: hypothetical protein AUI47_11385 [Acidobacteria bacterium 13_1_40CM_2_68_5]